MFFDRLGSDDWKIRRRIILTTLAYCAVMVIYLTVWGRENSISETAVTALIGLAGATIGSYVFGVIWDGKGKQPGSTTSIQQTVVTKDDPPSPSQPDPDPPPGYA